MTAITEDYLNITESFQYSNAIEKINYITAEPNPNININGIGTVVQITINPMGEWLRPAGAYLYVEGNLTKEDGTHFEKDPQGEYPDIALVNNAFPFLFSNMTYLLNSVELESFNNPGELTTIKALLTKQNSFAGIDQCWSLDTYDGQFDNEINYYPISNFL